MNEAVRVSLYNFNKIYLTYFNILYKLYIIAVIYEYVKLKRKYLVYYNPYDIVIFF